MITISSQDKIKIQVRNPVKEKGCGVLSEGKWYFWSSVQLTRCNDHCVILSIFMPFFLYFFQLLKTATFCFDFNLVLTKDWE